ncbi:hypothetical protein ACN47E_000191 [Coniothyrium glycines]
MPPSTRIPHLLQPYLQLPLDDSLLLVTSTLGASANWLLIRFLCDALNPTNDLGGGDVSRNVVLVSWMREYEFWRQEARKGTGLDLEKLRRDARFSFVDGLSGTCLETASATPTPSSRTLLSTSHTKPLQTLPARGTSDRLVPARGPALPSITPERVPATSVPATKATASKSTSEHYTLSSLDLAHLTTTISSAVSALASAAPTSQRKTLLVLDNPDLLLALNPAITPSSFASVLLALHVVPTVSHIVTHIQADNPLLSLSTPPQPLELSHNNLLVKCAHMSRRILGVRVLDTGVARDVSGVVRVTEQRTGWHGLGFESEGREGEEESDKGREFLYRVKGDGSVKVFERGAGGEA